MPRKSKGDGKPVGEPDRDYTELVLLVHANNPAEAELFKTELRGHGIPVVLEGEGSRTGIPDVGAGVPVLVPEEFADEAAELLAELESIEPSVLDGCLPAPERVQTSDKTWQAGLTAQENAMDVEEDTKEADVSEELDELESLEDEDEDLEDEDWDEDSWDDEDEDEDDD